METQTTSREVQTINRIYVGMLLMLHHIVHLHSLIDWIIILDTDTC